MKSKTVFVLERGEYSDYEVCGVFSTRENAEVAQQQFKSSYGGLPEINEWPLDPGIKELRSGRTLYMVRMYHNGDLIRCEASNGLKNSGPYFEYGNENRQIYAFVWARDDKHAIKIVGEMRARAIAENKL